MRKESRRAGQRASRRSSRQYAALAHAGDDDPASASTITSAPPERAHLPSSAPSSAFSPAASIRSARTPGLGQQARRIDQRRGGHWFVLFRRPSTPTRRGRGARKKLSTVISASLVAAKRGKSALARKPLLTRRLRRRRGWSCRITGTRRTADFDNGISR